MILALGYHFFTMDSNSPRRVAQSAVVAGACASVEDFDEVVSELFAGGSSLTVFVDTVASALGGLFVGGVSDLVVEGASDLVVAEASAGRSTAIVVGSLLDDGDSLLDEVSVDSSVVVATEVGVEVPPLVCTKSAEVSASGNIFGTNLACLSLFFSIEPSSYVSKIFQVPILFKSDMFAPAMMEPPSSFGL